MGFGQTSPPLVGPNAQLFPKSDFDGPPYGNNRIFRFTRLFLQQFEPSYPEIIENIREAVQKKIEAEQGCLKNEPDEEEADNADPEKTEDESLNPDGEDDEQAKEEE